jgi:hypothetical protein
MKEGPRHTCLNVGEGLLKACAEHIGQLPQLLGSRFPDGRGAVIGCREAQGRTEAIDQVVVSAPRAVLHRSVGDVV